MQPAASSIVHPARHGADAAASATAASLRHVSTAAATMVPKAIAVSAWLQRAGAEEDEIFRSKRTADARSAGHVSQNAGQDRARLLRMSQGVLRGRASQLWGAQGAERLALEVAGLRKLESADALKAALSGRDALERHTLLNALLADLGDGDPMATPARDLLVALERDEADDLTALRNVSAHFALAEHGEPGSSAKLRRVYVQGLHASAPGGASASAVAAGLLKEFGADGFEAALGQLRSGAERDARSRAPSRQSTRLHLSLAAGATLGLVQEAMAFARDVAVGCAQQGVRSTTSDSERALAMIEAASTGCRDVARLLAAVLGGDAAAACMGRPRVLFELRNRVAALRTTLWPADQAAARLDLLAGWSRLATVQDAAPRRGDDAAARLRSAAAPAPAAAAAA